MSRSIRCFLLSFLVWRISSWRVRRSLGVGGEVQCHEHDLALDFGLFVGEDLEGVLILL